MRVETVQLDLGAVGRLRELLDLNVEVVDLAGDRLGFGLLVAHRVAVCRVRDTAGGEQRGSYADCDDESIERHGRGCPINIAWLRPKTHRHGNGLC